MSVPDNALLVPQTTSTPQTPPTQTNPGLQACVWVVRGKPPVLRGADGGDGAPHREAAQRESRAPLLYCLHARVEGTGTLRPPSFGGVKVSSLFPLFPFADLVNRNRQRVCVLIAFYAYIYCIELGLCYIFYAMI